MRAEVLAEPTGEDVACGAWRGPLAGHPRYKAGRLLRKAGPLMRVTLIHNPGSGEGSSSTDELTELLEDAGYTVRSQSTKADDWESVLKKRAELIVVAGGDGTVTKVTRSLPDEAVFTIVPVGTANNIATSLGIHGSPKRVIAGLAKATARPFDLWTATGPWGEATVVEGAGLGAITETATALHLADRLTLDPLDKLSLARMVMKNLVRRLRPFDLRAKCDGNLIEGSFLAFEVTNIGLAGPQLSLCGNARSVDGRLDVAVVRENERDRFVKWLGSGAARSWRVKPLRRCKTLEIEWSGGRLRLADGTVWPPMDDEEENGGKRTKPKRDKDRGIAMQARFSRTKRTIKVLAPK